MSTFHAFKGVSSISLHVLMPNFVLGEHVGIAISKTCGGYWPDNCHSFFKPPVHTKTTSLPFIFRIRFVAYPGIAQNYIQLYQLKQAEDPAAKSPGPNF